MLNLIEGFETTKEEMMGNILKEDSDIFIYRNALSVIYKPDSIKGYKRHFRTNIYIIDDRIYFNYNEDLIDHDIVRSYHDKGIGTVEKFGVFKYQHKHMVSRCLDEEFLIFKYHSKFVEDCFHIYVKGSKEYQDCLLSMNLNLIE